MKKTQKTILALLILICGIDSLSAQDRSKTFKKDMDAFVDEVYTAFNIKFGMGMSVVKDGKMIYEKYQGLADIENNIPVTPDTRFYIASSTKSFVALSALILHEQKKINLDKSLADYFPQGKFQPEARANEVTIRDLLTHTSGLLNNNVTGYKAYIGNYTTSMLIDNLIHYTTTNKVGKGNFNYDNLGYNIFELILEQELGKDWKQVCRETVLGPLEMNQTTGNMSDLARYNWPGTEPYVQKSLEDTPDLIPFKKQDVIMHAAGGLVSTPRDMAKWLIAQTNGGLVDGKQIFPNEMIAFSHLPHAKQKREFIDLKRFGYGYGWNIATDFDGDTLIHHYGGFPGTHAEVSIMPEYDMGVSMAVNEGDDVGLIASYLIVSYAFDYFAHPSDVDESYYAAIENYKGMLAQNFQASIEEKERREKRKWNLELPFKAYAGTYESTSLGTLELKHLNRKNMHFKLGLVETDLITPFTEKNSMRIEFLGSGDVIRFNIENGEVKSLVYNGLLFRKQ